MTLPTRLMYLWLAPAALFCGEALAQSAITPLTTSEYLEHDFTYQAGYTQSLIDQNFALDGRNSAADMEFFAKCLVGGRISLGQMVDGVKSSAATDPGLLAQPVSIAIRRALQQICGRPKG